MGTNIHERHRAASDQANPPPGRNDDDSHALQAGREGATPRRSVHGKDASTRDAGRDDRRSGSDSGRSD